MTSQSEQLETETLEELNTISKNGVDVDDMEASNNG